MPRNKRSPVGKKLECYAFYSHVEIPDLASYKRSAQAQAPVVEDDGSKRQFYKFRQYGSYGREVVGRFKGNECLVLTGLLTALHARNKDLFWAFIEKRVDKKKMGGLVEEFHLLYLERHLDYLNNMASFVSPEHRSMQAFFVREIYINAGNGKTNRHASEIAAIMAEHGIEAGKIAELIHGISGAGNIETVEQIARARLGRSANDNRALDYTDEDYAAAKDYRERCIKEVLSLIKEHGAEEEFNAYLNQIAPHLMQEDSAREQVYVDDFMPKHWYFQEEGALDVFIDSMRPDNMVNIYLGNNKGEGQHTDNSAHWVSMGVIKDKSGQYKFAFFDPIYGLYLCSNKKQLKDAFNRCVGVYVRDNCIALVVNQALAMETVLGQQGGNGILVSDAFNQHLSEISATIQVTHRAPEAPTGDAQTNSPSDPLNQLPPEAPQPTHRAQETPKSDVHSDSLWHRILQKLASAFSWILTIVTFGIVKPRRSRHGDGSPNKPSTAPRATPVHMDAKMRSGNISKDHGPNATLSSVEAANGNEQKAVSAMREGR